MADWALVAIPETAAPYKVDPQVAYFDGYTVGDLLLEGLRFKVEVVNGELVCNGAHPDDQTYLNNAGSAERIKGWCEAVIAEVTEGSPMMDEAGEIEIYWEEFEE